MTKYEFLITLPYDFEVYSSYYDGQQVWPHFSHADPYTLKGIFDTYEEAERKKKASQSTNM